MIQFNANMEQDFFNSKIREIPVQKLSNKWIQINIRIYQNNNSSAQLTSDHGSTFHTAMQREL